MDENIPNRSPQPYKGENLSPNGDDVSLKPPPPPPPVSRGIFATLTEAAAHLASSMCSPPTRSFERLPPSAEELSERSQEDKRVETDGDTDAMVDDIPYVELDAAEKMKFKTDINENYPPSAEPSVSDPILGDSTVSNEIIQGGEKIEEDEPLKMEDTVIIEETEEFLSGKERSDVRDEDNIMAEKLKNIRRTADSLTEKRLGEDLDSALDELQKRIADALAAMKNERSNPIIEVENRKKSNVIYANLRNSSIKAHKCLTEYGSEVDMSAREPGGDDRLINVNESIENKPILGEDRRSKLLKFGKNLWMIVRSNPDLFNDIITRESEENDREDDSFISSFEGKKHQAVAGGYTRAIAARLVFLDYIDTRGSIGNPPSLRQHESLTSVKTLGFGLKTFCRAGRAILTHNKNDPRGAYDSLSLAKSCFNAIQALSKTNDEAVNELPGLVDEAFDMFFMLPNAASIFGSYSVDEIGDIKWASLVVLHLKQAEVFLNERCNTAACFDGDKDEHRCDEKKQPGSKFAMLQRYLPSFARLCYKHGSHFAKIEDYDNANEALHIALKTTDSCLREIRQALVKEAAASDQNLKARGMHLQVLHNLEASLVVVSIESFYVLSSICQSTGKREAAITCLDQIEKYMDEQQARDKKLFSDVMTNLKDCDSFVFSEESGATDGPKKQDKRDIKSRAQTAQMNSNSRHAKEQATLAFSRIMVFHKTLPSPTKEEEAFIDAKIGELVELAWKYKNEPADMRAISSANQISTDDNSSDSDHIFKITLQAIRVVHIRRILSKATKRCDYGSTPYKSILNKFQNTHRRPFILLDQLNAILTAQYKVRQDECNEGSRTWLDKEAMTMANEFIDIVTDSFQQSSSTDKGSRDYNTTLFVPRDQLLRNQLLQDTKIHFARAVSLYHASKDYKLCAYWSDLLHNVLKINCVDVSLDEENALLNQVLLVKAFSQSMCGDEAMGMRTAREAWETQKVKTVDGLVTLFHCGVRYEMKCSSCDTMLEFDNACNELLSAQHRDAGVNEIISAFPRMSNSCVENEVDGGGHLLLSTQERWLSMMLRSSIFQQNLKDRKNIEPPGGHSLFEILRAYLQNFENVISTQDRNRVCQHGEALVRILDGVFDLLCKVRQRKQQKKSGRRKKKVTEFALIWDDPATNKLLGNRTDCVWTAEQLWNIGNLLMAEVAKSTTGVVRRFASDSFAASHDFCIFSEEEEGALLSKGYLNYDTKYNSENLSVPLFCGANADKPFCEISSEFSAQCLLLSSATALDYTSNCLDQPKSEAENLLRQTLQRLSLAQDEFRVNCEDENQKKEVETMISLLTLRALLGIGDDVLGAEILQANGLSKALFDSHQEELGESSNFSTLCNVKALSDLAEVKKMPITARILLRMCAKMLPLAGKFVLTVGHSELSLGDIQRKLITSASSTKDIIGIYKDVDLVAKQHRDKGSEFYSENELTWLIIEAYNRGVHLSLLGDFASAESLFSIGLNLLPLGCIEIQCHAKEMRNALSNAVTNQLGATDSNFLVTGIGG